MGSPGPPGRFALRAFFTGTRGDTGPALRGKRVRCRWSGEMEPDPKGPAALYGVVTDNYTSLDMARGGTPVLRYRQWPPGPPRERYEPAGGATSMMCFHATWLCRCAHVESGYSGPLGGRNTCCQVQVLERSPYGGEGVGLRYGTKPSGYTDLGPLRGRETSPDLAVATVAGGLRRSGPPEWT